MQDSLEKQLVCPICLEVFTKPVVILPCQHNLCRKCANDVFQAANPYMTTRSGGTVTSGGRFRCPSCRHEVVLDRHGVYGLQRNLLVENIIDMMKQGSSSPKPLPEPKVEQPMCEEHTEEKINIYCVTCGVPTCSMCKVFGAHKDCEVAPLNNVFTKQKGELTDCISMLVGNNERLQAIITQLEETCRTIDENGRRQKSKVCETFDHLYAILEEKKTDMTLQITGEQEEKLDYIRCLRRRYTEHLESMAKVLETGIQTMEQSEMAVFLQDAKPLLQKIIEGTNTSHLEKVERGYEIFDHFTTNFERQRRALHDLSFIIPDEEEDEESEEELMLEVPTAALPQPVGVPKSPLPPQSLVGGATLPPLPKSPQPPQSLVGGTAMPPVPKSPLPPQPAAGSASVPVARSPQPPLLSGSSAVPSPRSPQPPLGAVGSVAFPTQPLGAVGSVAFPTQPLGAVGSVAFPTQPMGAVGGSVAFPTQPLGAGSVAFPPLPSQHQRPAEGLSATPPVAFPPSQAPSQATPPVAFPSSQAPSQATPPVAFPSSQAPSQATPPVAFPSSQAPSQATPPVAFPTSQAPSQATPPVAFPTSPATPSQATAASQPQASSDPSGGGEDVDGPRHVFSFSWLNQK